MTFVPHLTTAAVLLLAAASAVSSATESSCTLQNNVIVSAKTPEVDLFAVPSDVPPVSTMTKADFPSCLPILAASKSGMLQVEINGKKYWVPAYMVLFRSSANTLHICRRIAADLNTTTGTDRGLGEGCK